MEIVIGVIGLIIAFIGLKLTFFAKPKQELENLKILFRGTQKKHLEVQDELEELIKNRNCGDCLLVEGFTFNSYFLIMRNSYETYLSDKLLVELDNMKLTKSNIQSMTNSIEKQLSNLQNVQDILKVLKYVN